MIIIFNYIYIILFICLVSQPLTYFFLLVYLCLTYLVKQSILISNICCLKYSELMNMYIHSYLDIFNHIYILNM